MSDYLSQTPDVTEKDSNFTKDGRGSILTGDQYGQVNDLTDMRRRNVDRERSINQFKNSMMMFNDKNGIDIGSGTPYLDNK